VLLLKYFVATVEETVVGAQLGRLIEAMLGRPCIWFSERVRDALL
jgi:predicted metal-dependent HD superfamily phosphohydrolase